jgi:hypothetical protein
MQPSSSPFSGIGTFLQLSGVVVSAVMGFKEVGVILAVVSGAALFQAGYTLVRWPQMIGVWQRDGVGIVKLVFFQLIIQLLLAAVFYGIGRGIAWIIR